MNWFSPDIYNKFQSEDADVVNAAEMEYNEATMKYHEDEYCFFFHTNCSDDKL